MGPQQQQQHWQLWHKSELVIEAQAGRQAGKNRKRNWKKERSDHWPWRPEKLLLLLNWPLIETTTAKLVCPLSRSSSSSNGQLPLTICMLLLLLLLLPLLPANQTNKKGALARFMCGGVGISVTRAFSFWLWLVSLVGEFTSRSLKLHRRWHCRSKSSA